MVDCFVFLTRSPRFMMYSQMLFLLRFLLYLSLPYFFAFKYVIEDEIHIIITKSPTKSCVLYHWKKFL